MKELTAERLRELLHYDPETGVFTRAVRTSNRTHVGDIAGTCNTLGYRSICIDSRYFAEHRLAWLYVTGRWPVDDIDHLDGNRANNAFRNLRDVPRATNLQNQRRASRNSKTGFLGVIAYGEKFRATISLNRTHRFLGTFDTPEEAHQAYLKAKRAIHDGCTL